MALDVHAGKSEAIASQRKRWAFFDEYVHAALIGKINRLSPTNSRSITVSCCPLLNRLQDFYSDCRYDLDELEPLREEIQAIKPEFTSDRRVITQLEMFEKACRDALNGNLNLYVFAD
ncbi:MAG: hypothetical protein KME42_10585 [Tildeniella nuda ZEHNDER 1965/U140]|jgi:hypothetical protein|nr:hypothetical protein [Tildeniella nuda ZEHNDER 1965/U140]